MQIDATTFVLELINFAILVWILHRFLYRPILAAIDRRRSAIEASIEEARSTREAAEKLRQAYEDRFTGWEQERAQARATLTAELAAQREKALAEVARSAEQERDRLAAVQARRTQDLQRETEEHALEQAAAFAARLLERLAGPETDARLIDTFLADLDGWPAARIDELRAAAHAVQGRVQVTSARSLDAAAQARVTQALEARLELRCEAAFDVDAALLAGLCVAIGPWLLQADLRDELQYFASGPEDVR